MVQVVSLLFPFFGFKNGKNVVFVVVFVGKEIYFLERIDINESMNEHFCCCF